MSKLVVDYILRFARVELPTNEISTYNFDDYIRFEKCKFLPYLFWVLENKYILQAHNSKQRCSTWIWELATGFTSSKAKYLITMVKCLTAYLYRHRYDYDFVFFSLNLLEIKTYLPSIIRRKRFFHRKTATPLRAMSSPSYGLRNINTEVGFRS